MEEQFFIVSFKKPVEPTPNTKIPLNIFKCFGKFCQVVGIIICYDESSHHVVYIRENKRSFYLYDDAKVSKVEWNGVSKQFKDTKKPCLLVLRNLEFST